MAAGVGLLACVMMWAVGDQRPVAAIGVGAVAFAVAGLLFSVIFCSASRGPAATTAATGASAAPAAAAPAAAVTTPAATAAPKAAAAKPAAPKTAKAEKAKPAPKAAKPKATPAKAEPAPSADGKRPKALKAARGGKADNLKEIKGIGPNLETLCNTLGFYHFDQIAGWSADEIAWVDQNLEGFKGRVSRDQWVRQAKVLAAGGETEFSKRVEGGDVY